MLVLCPWGRLAINKNPLDSLARYKTTPNARLGTQIKEALRERLCQVSWLVFFSPSAVRGCVQTLKVCLAKSLTDYGMGASQQLPVCAKVVTTQAGVRVWVRRRQHLSHVMVGSSAVWHKSMRKKNWIFPQEHIPQWERVKLAAIGPTTAHEMTAAGLTVRAMATKPCADDLVEAISKGDTQWPISNK
jgi:uroporphyrinogen-III synthase